LVKIYVALKSSFFYSVLIFWKRKVVP